MTQRLERSSPLAGVQVPATEERYAGQHEERDRKGNQGRVREEGGKSAPAKDGEPEIGKGRHYGDER